MSKEFKDAFVKVGVAVYVFNPDGKLLAGLRKGSHGEGTWAVPGGHQEPGETLEDTAHREVREETEVGIRHLKFVGFTNDIFESEGKHYITVFFSADHASGEPKIMEPDKCTRLEWIEPAQLWNNSFLPIQNMLNGKGYGVDPHFLAKFGNKPK